MLAGSCCLADRHRYWCPSWWFLLAPAPGVGVNHPPLRREP